MHPPYHSCLLPLLPPRVRPLSSDVASPFLCGPRLRFARLTRTPFLCSAFCCTSSLSADMLSAPCRAFKRCAFFFAPPLEGSHSPFPRSFTSFYGFRKAFGTFVSVFPLACTNHFALSARRRRSFCFWSAPVLHRARIFNQGAVGPPGARILCLRPSRLTAVLRRAAHNCPSAPLLFLCRLC